MFLVVSILLCPIVRHLHVGCAGGDQQGGAHMPQLVRGVADNAVRVRGGVALSQLEVLAPGGIAQVPAPVTVDQTAVQAALTALAPGAPRSERRRTADMAMSGIITVRTAARVFLSSRTSRRPASSSRPSLRPGRFELGLPLAGFLTSPGPQRLTAGGRMLAAWSHKSGAQSAVRCTPRALRSGCATGRRCPRRRSECRCRAGRPAARRP